MKIKEKLKQIQDEIAQSGLDGWLLYDFRGSNDIATRFLGIPKNIMCTRRFYYWIPKMGEPIKIVSAIESKNLDHLPGEKRIYRTWQDLNAALTMRGKIAMEYSITVPYISKVDGGTIDLLRNLGMEIVSSGDILQKFFSVWDDQQLDHHRFAAKVLCHAATSAWKFIEKNIDKISEYDVQQHILQFIEDNGCTTDEPPICAVNENLADPHYLPSQNSSSPIKKGDFILIDLFCHKNEEGAPWADITQVGVAAPKPTVKQQMIFDLVKKGRDAATNLVREKPNALMGYEVDQICRDVIEGEGYGEFFLHRTGHNLDTKLHGSGAHIDNFETQDRRHLIPRTCFTIEPGIYLPGEFGVRLEYDVFIHTDGRIEINGGIQDEIVTMDIK